jgi:hypothetical protein
MSENIADAYRYLMQTFELDDVVYIFGFSRGAYTARALCGMLEVFGLLSHGNEGMIPYAIRLFKHNDRGFLSFLRSSPNKFRTAAGFKSTFCADCKPHFVGVWDTVSSVGWILDPIGLKPGSLPYTAELGDVSVIRHAVAMDERRAFFRQNLVNERQGRDIKQVWFAGVHSDVGGSYREAESGLSKISLSWMLREATDAGLLVDKTQVDEILGGNLSYSKPVANATMHNSLTPAWWIGEFWPKFVKKKVSFSGVEPPVFVGRPRFNFFRRRFIPADSCIHASVLSRKELLPSYTPKNLSATYSIEPDRETVPYPIHLEPGEKFITSVHSRLKWNDTTLILLKGERYSLEASGTWHDAGISSRADGYPSSSFLFRILERLRRSPGDNWFALIGAIGRGESKKFLIGQGVQKDIEADGVLHCFANDLPFLYFNNFGYIKLKVGRIS